MIGSLASCIQSTLFKLACILTASFMANLFILALIVGRTLILPLNYKKYYRKVKTPDDRHHTWFTSVIGSRNHSIRTNACNNGGGVPFFHNTLQISLTRIADNARIDTLLVVTCQSWVAVPVCQASGLNSLCCCLGRSKFGYQTMSQFATSNKVSYASDHSRYFHLLGEEEDRSKISCDSVPHKWHLLRHMALSDKCHSIPGQRSHTSHWCYNPGPLYIQLHCIGLWGCLEAQVDRYSEIGGNPLHKLLCHHRKWSGKGQHIPLTHRPCPEDSHYCSCTHLK